MGAVLLVATVPSGCGVVVLFLGSTYTTVGYGDLVLPQEWRVAPSLAAYVFALATPLVVA